MGQVQVDLRATGVLRLWRLLMHVIDGERYALLRGPPRRELLLASFTPLTSCRGHLIHTGAMRIVDFRFSSTAWRAADCLPEGAKVLACACGSEVNVHNALARFIALVRDVRAQIDESAAAACLP